MLRCTSAGRYRVRFKYLDTPYGEERAEEYLADIGSHQPVYGELEGRRVVVEDIPRASQQRPYEGELCACELDWLRHMPGREYSFHRRYEVEKLTEPRHKKTAKE